MYKLFSLISLLVLSFGISVQIDAQTLYVPGGSVGSSTVSGNVGVGVVNPSSKLQVAVTANQSIGVYAPSGSAIGDYSLGGIGWMFARPEDGAFAHAIYSYNSTGGAKNNLAISARDDLVFTAGNGGPSGAPERMRIGGNGCIGIGTSTPVFALDVTNNNYNAIRASGNSANSVGIFVRNTCPSGRQWAIISSGGGPAPAGNFSIWDDTASSSRLTIDALGNIGVGTSSPGMKLDVRQTAADSNNYGIYSYANGAGINNYGAYFDASGAANNYALYTNVGNVVLAATNGNVGIGTSNPSQKLSVNGTIRAKEVIVETTGWSDYVLTKTYALAPLSEVEKHINESGTLPGMPSEREVVSHGIGVGEMQAKLLAKVEELTLHLIAQEKKIDEQQSKIEQLEKALASARNFK